MKAGEQLQSERSGTMTLGEHAAFAFESSVLRIAMVRAGRVLKERILSQSTPVTLGSFEGCVFPVPADAVPEGFRLFELVDGQYCLNYFDSMSGRLTLAAGNCDLAQLTRQSRCVSVGQYQLQLTENARGRLVLGDTTFLFQLELPQSLLKNQELNGAVLRGSAGIERTTTVIAALSFLLHFLAIGALFSDWQDPIVDDDATLANIVELIKSLPPPPPVEQGNDERPRPHPRFGELEYAVHPQLPLDWSQRPQNFHPVPNPQNTRPPERVVGPRGNVNVQPPTVTGGAVANAIRVVAGMRAGFRNCYNRALATDPDAFGAIRLTLKIGPGGEVEQVSANPTGNLGSAVECAKMRAHSAQFDPPEGRRAAVVFTVNFVKP